MSSSAEQVKTLLRQLADSPDLRHELRRVLGVDGLGELTAAMGRLAEAQTRTEDRFAELAAAEARTEERLERVEAAIEKLAAAQVRAEERFERVEAAIEKLAAAEARTAERLAELTVNVNKLTNTVADLKGRSLEQDYARKAGAYFGRLLRKVRVVPIQEIEDELEARLTADEFDELLALDLLVTGRRRRNGDEVLYLAVEVSSVVDRSDVERAHRRAALLRKAGLPAIPAVAGEARTEGAREECRSRKVLQLEDGTIEGWEEAQVGVRTE